MANKKFRVFIDVGHGNVPKGFDPGAVHVDPVTKKVTTEHSLNLIIAHAMAGALASAGVDAVVDDTSRGLWAGGAAATGFDVMVSCHHNATNPGSRAQYSVALVHETKGTARDVRCAAAVSAAIAKALGIRDVGVKRMKLGVLSGAKDAKVPVALLMEPFFIHHQSPDNPAAANMPAWSKRAGEAAASAIVEYLGAREAAA